MTNCLTVVEAHFRGSILTLDADTGILNMDWSTVTASVAGSLLGAAAISAGITFILKHTITRSIDMKFEQLKEKQRLDVQETMRRKAAIFDKQSDVYIKFVSIVFSLRHKVREIVSTDSKPRESVLAEFVIERAAFWSFVTQNRALLTDRVLVVQHELRNIEQYLELTAKLIEENGMQSRDKHYSELRDAAERLNACYLELVHEVQAYISLPI